MRVNPVAGRSAVAKGLVGDIDQHIIFLTFQRVRDIDPVLGGLRHRCGFRFLTVARRIVNLQHADNAVVLAQGDDVGDFVRRCARPPLAMGAIGEHYPDNVGACVGDVGNGAIGLAGIPGMGVIDAPHHEGLTVTIQKLGAGNRESRPGR